MIDRDDRVTEFLLFLLFWGGLKMTKFVLLIPF